VRTISKVHFASRFSKYNCSSQLRENKQKLHISYLTSWNNSIFGYKLRTDQEQLRLKIFKKFKNSEPNSKFTGSYKKV